MENGDNEVIDNWDPILLEYPFVRQGMTAKEYEEEKRYLAKHYFTDYRNGTYKPLWQQREEESASR